MNLPDDWVIKEGLQVAIIGAGMAGISLGFALKRLGIHAIQLFDESPYGKEGPWVTYARMRHLRSGKDLVGPALDYPELTFETYYQNIHGNDAWKNLYKIPNQDWNDYLLFLRKTLDIPVDNETKIELIEPSGAGFLLHTSKGTITVPRVVLATGRNGFGGPIIPSFIQNIEKDYWAHAVEPINFSQLKNKKVAVLGIGAAGFDSAACALEAGASQVDMLTRRSQINDVNKFADTFYAGFNLGFYFLPDEDKLKFIQEGRAQGAIPPFESIKRAAQFPNFRVIPNLTIHSIKSPLVLETNQGSHPYDFLILATGYDINIDKVPLLKKISSQIPLWRNFLTPTQQQTYPRACPFPYLGPHFQMLPRLYCFNFAATQSHGLLSGDIPGIGIGASRLASGIATELFLEDKDAYYQRLVAYNTKEFNQKDVPYRRLI